MRKEELLSFATICMNPEDIMLDQKRQAQEDKYCVNSFICRIQKTVELIETKWNGGWDVVRGGLSVKGYKLPIII